MFNFLNHLEGKKVKVFDLQSNEFKGTITRIFNQGEFTIFIEIDGKILLNASQIKRIEIDE